MTILTPEQWAAAWATIREGADTLGLSSYAEQVNSRKAELQERYPGTSFSNGRYAVHLEEALEAGLKVPDSHLTGMSPDKILPDWYAFPNLIRRMRWTASDMGLNPRQEAWAIQEGHVPSWGKTTVSHATREATNAPAADACPQCGTSRAANPGLFAAGQTLCTGCADMLHEREETMEREWNEGRFSASRYHAASRLLSAADEDDGWEWSHSHTCPECRERWTCSSDSCEPGPMECPTCEDLIAAESVPPPEGYVEQPMTPSDLAFRDL